MVEAAVQREMAAVRNLSLSERVDVHDTGRVDGAIAARNNSLASSIQDEPQAPGLARASSISPSRRAGAVPGSSAVFSMAVDWFGFGYAALVTSGGLIGYVKAGSVPSLAAGLFFGGLAGLGAYQLSQNPNNIWLSLITSGTLSAIMGTRFYNSRKFMPAGLIAGVSLLMVGRLALKMLEKPQDK
ncbi:transmembrane protein 14C-like isoform X2 [Chiroxiphia lanceolata]|uniref:transmembrane protein 14C-like isoform X2 n=1 Tax=Chiroxiphia lanceolata TaxID=296741 RepID=UPI0013CEA96B|nr:transmembrane protein 14C-like isoform X2 [Chiroxiphia lanceolata]